MNIIIDVVYLISCNIHYISANFYAKKSVTWDIMSLTVVFTEEDRVVTEFLL